MTAHQQSKLNELAQDYMSTSDRPSNDGTESIDVDVFDVSLPERCVVCAEEELHPNHPAVWDGPDDRFHFFRVAVPVATFRISPSGFRQRIDPVETAA